MARKKTVGMSIAFLAIGATAGLGIYLELQSQRKERAFYLSGVNSVIVRKSDWQKRSIDIYLDNGMSLNFSLPAAEKINVGDSVVKPVNTFKYKIFRKAGSAYDSVYTYDYRIKI